MYAAGGKHLFFQTTGSYPVALSDCWLAIAAGYQPWATFGAWVYPQLDGRTYLGTIDLTRISVESSDGSYLWFAGSNNTITGRFYRGVPSGGDFVTRSLAGSGYVSPGYS